MQSHIQDKQAKAERRVIPAKLIIYGHTHKPVCHESGGILYINPGSFQATGRFGAPGTFAILEVGKDLQATLYEISVLRRRISGPHGK